MFVKAYLAVAFQLFAPLCFSQVVNDSNNETLQLSAGHSKHGTGDIKGLSYQAEYSRYVKRFCWSVGFSGSIHDMESLLYFNVPPPYGRNQEVNGSYRSTTAGVQVQGLGGYSLLRTRMHELQTDLGLIFRYQSISVADVVAVYYPAAGTGFPFPVYSLQNTEPQRTVAIGGMGRIQYKFHLNKKYYAGILAGLQLDSNGDVLQLALVSVGRTF